MIKHNFKKQYGQNFLVSTRFTMEFIDSLDIKVGETIIEIGPGDGMITGNILNNFENRMFSIEIDYDLLPNLVRRYSRFENFRLIHTDVLQFDLAKFIEEYNIKGDIKIIGALPYNISKKIIDKFLHHSIEEYQDTRIAKMSFIVQEEVAKDYTAKAPQASFLSNYVRLFGEVRKLKSIPAQKFVPMPKVNGAILVFDLANTIPENFMQLKKLIRLGFSSPRKTLIRNLSNIKELKEKDLPSVFLELGINSKARPAELTAEQWQQLFSKIID